MSGPAAATIVVEQRLAAPPERVYDAWLDRAALGRWLFATEGGVMEQVEVDPRVGGGFTVIERRGADRAEHHGEYVALERPSRLAFDFWTSFSAERTRVTIAIAADGEGSRLTLTHDGVWPDWADKTRQGWTTILEGLDRVLGIERGD